MHAKHPQQVIPRRNLDPEKAGFKIQDAITASTFFAMRRAVFF